MDRAFLAQIIVTDDSLKFGTVEEIEVPFPYDLALLDSFQRSNEKPLSDSGKWSIGLVENTGEIVSEAWQASGTGTFKQSEAYWNSTQYASVAVELHALGGNNNTLQLNLYGEPTKEEKGYRFYVAEEATAGKFSGELQRSAPSSKGLGSGSKWTFVAGDFLGLSIEGGKVKAWHKKVGGEWEVLLEAADSTYTQGYPGMYAAHTTWALRNFEAG